MKVITKMLGIVAFLLFLGSCNKDFKELNEQNEHSAANTDAVDQQTRGAERGSDDPYIVLGKKKKIAYSVENMQKAVDFINTHKKDSQYKGRKISKTHFYVKYTPNKEEDYSGLNIMESRNHDIVFFNYPLDYEIIKEGSILKEDENNQFPALYTTMTVSQYDSYHKDAPSEVLAELYMPKEEEADLEVVAMVLADDTEDLEGIEVNGKPISKDNLVEFLQLKPERWGWLRRYRPNGYVKVYDTSVSKDVPLKRTRVNVTRAFRSVWVYTDDEGRFVSKEKFRFAVRVRATWNTGVATIRSTGTELIAPKKIGFGDHLMKLRRKKNGKIYFIRHENSHLWCKGTVHNALIKYNDYAESVGVTGVHSANVWVLQAGEKIGMTGMLRTYNYYSLKESIKQIMIKYLGASEISSKVWSTIVSAVIGDLAPDIVFMLDKKDTEVIDQLVFHEAGHFSHARQSGGKLWGKLVKAELNNILNSGKDKDPYRDGLSPNKEAGNLIALAEGWATFMEYATMTHYYPNKKYKNENNLNSFSIPDYMEYSNTYVRPHKVVNDNNSWFLTGLIWDVVDGVNYGELSDGGLVDYYTLELPKSFPIVDHLQLGNISSDLSPVYDRLNGDVASAIDLERALKTAYPNSTREIIELFESHGCHK